MLYTKTNTVYQNLQNNKWFLAMIIVLSLPTIIYANYYLTISIVNVVELLFILYIIIQSPKIERSTRLLPILLVLFLIGIFTNSLSIFYLWGFSIMFYAIELYWKKLPSEIWYLTVLNLPMFIFGLIMIGTPIRLELSNLAGEILTTFDKNLLVKGNLITYKGEQFLVDVACAGLKMTEYSFFIGIGYLYFYKKEYNKKLSLLIELTILSRIFILNLFSNFFRILILIIFKLPPENIMHDVVGIICWVIYVIVPTHFILAYVIKKNGKSQTDQLEYKPYYKFHFTSIIILLLSIYKIYSFNIHKDFVIQNEQKFYKKGYSYQKLNDGILQLKNEKALIYIKPIDTFKSSEHTPNICWTGSSYEFKQFYESKINGQTLYIGTLEKNNQTLYTAWWYQLNSKNTVSQWEWRLNMLFNNSTCNLINVTVSDKKLLINEVKKFWGN